jgi:hypothetical protein
VQGIRGPVTVGTDHVLRKLPTSSSRRAEAGAHLPRARLHCEAKLLWGCRGSHACCGHSKLVITLYITILSQAVCACM